MSGARPAESVSAAHSKRIQVKLEHRLLLLPVGAFHLAQPNDLTHDPRVESRAFCLRINFANIISQGLFFFFKTLDALDERTQMFFCKTGFGHFILRNVLESCHPGQLEARNTDRLWPSTADKG